MKVIPRQGAAPLIAFCLHRQGSLGYLIQKLVGLMLQLFALYIWILRLFASLICRCNVIEIMYIVDKIAYNCAAHSSFSLYLMRNYLKNMSASEHYSNKMFVLLF